MEFFETIISIIVSGLRSSSPLLFVLMGEIYCERGGVVNLGVEGQMLLGAMTAFAFTAITGSPYMGILCGALAATMLSSIHAALTLHLHANHFASGIAILLLGGGLSAFFGTEYVGVKIDGFGGMNLGFIGDIPLIGPAIEQFTPTVYLALILSGVLGLAMYKTRWGLRIRAVGESELVARSLGINPLRYQWTVVLLGGFLSGLGGAALAVDYTRNWIEWMTAGRGLIAVGLVIVARWNPYLAIPAAFLFGGTEATTLQLQSAGVQISPFILSMAPYLVCLAVLIYGSYRTRLKGGMPKGLANVFSAVE